MTNSLVAMLVTYIYFVHMITAILKHLRKRVVSSSFSY